MSNTITIEMETRAVTDALRRVVKSLTNPNMVLEPIGELLIESTKRRFETSTAPDGTPWKPTKRGNKPLVDTGAL